MQLQEAITLTQLLRKQSCQLEESIPTIHNERVQAYSISRTYPRTYI